MHSPFTPNTHRPAGLTHSSPTGFHTTLNYSSTHTPLNTAILLSTSPNYLVLPRRPLLYSTVPFTYVAMLRPYYSYTVCPCPPKSSFRRGDFHPSLLGMWTRCKAPRALRLWGSGCSSAASSGKTHPRGRKIALIRPQSVRVDYPGKGPWSHFDL